MTETDATPARPTFLDRQRDAALEMVKAQQDEFRRIADIALPRRNDPTRRTSERVTDVIRLGEDYLVELTDKDRVLWTFVVDGETNFWRHERQVDAILHLIASRYGRDMSTNHLAAIYAGRVLGVPETDAA